MTCWRVRVAAAWLRLIALIEEAAVIARILRHLGLPTEIPEARPRGGRTGTLSLDVVAATAIIGAVVFGEACVGGAAGVRDGPRSINQRTLGRAPCVPGQS